MKQPAMISFFRKITGPIAPCFKWLTWTIRFTRKVIGEFFKDHAPVRAAGLAYSTILALVPFSALLFSLFTAFGAFEQALSTFETFLIDQLIPTKQDEIVGYINRFVENAGTLGVIGLTFFTITSIFLIDSVSNVFNTLWHTRSRRNFLGKLTVYISVIVVGSLLISASLSVTSYITSSFPAETLKEIGLFTKLFFNIIPVLFIFLVLLLMITLLPSVRVRFPSALLGSFVGTILWEIAKNIFIYVTNSVIRISIIYGSIAVIPVFLFWIYLVWNIILFSLKVSYVHQYKSTSWDMADIESFQPQARLTLGLEIFFSVAESFELGKNPPDENDLSRKIHISPGIIREYLTMFTRGKLLVLTESGRILPQKALTTITMEEVLSVLYGNGHEKKGSLAADIAETFRESAFSPTEKLTVLEALRKSSKNG